jgi:hypothetical protein
MDTRGASERRGHACSHCAKRASESTRLSILFKEEFAIDLKATQVKVLLTRGVEARLAHTKHLVPLCQGRIGIQQPGAGAPSSSQPRILLMILDRRPHLAVLASLKLPVSERVRAIFPAVPKSVGRRCHAATFAKVNAEPRVLLVVYGAALPLAPHHRCVLLLDLTF